MKVHAMNAEDLTAIEGAGRRCSVCHTGRNWRRFEVVRRDGREPLVLCGGCKARFGDEPPGAASESPPATTPVAGSEQPVGKKEKKPGAGKNPRNGERRSDRRPDRLRAALRELPSSFSTATAARAAGLNHAKTLARLNELERRHEVRRVGGRWTTEPAPDEIASAMDRLEARTSNLRIVRERARVS
jgi:hypothetical protein